MSRKSYYLQASVRFGHLRRSTKHGIDEYQTSTKRPQRFIIYKHFCVVALWYWYQNLGQPSEAHFWPEAAGTRDNKEIVANRGQQQVNRVQLALPCEATGKRVQEVSLFTSIRAVWASEAEYQTRH